MARRTRIWVRGLRRSGSRAESRGQGTWVRVGGGGLRRRGELGEAEARSGRLSAGPRRPSRAPAGGRQQGRRPGTGRRPPLHQFPAATRRRSPGLTHSPPLAPAGRPPPRPRIPRERRPGVQPERDGHWGCGFPAPKAAPEFGVESRTLASPSRGEGDHHPAALLRGTAPQALQVSLLAGSLSCPLSDRGGLQGECPLLMGGCLPLTVASSCRPLTNSMPFPAYRLILPHTAG